MANVKPTPDLSEKASEAIVFEKSLHGLIAAKTLGLPTVIVPNPVIESLPDVKLALLSEMSCDDLLDHFQDERVGK